MKKKIEKMYNTKLINTPTPLSSFCHVHVNDHPCETKSSTADNRQ